MKGQPVFGVTVGNGAALNIELGFVPEFVQLYNATDGDLITTAFLTWVVPFSGGGTTEITAGSTIKGAATPRCATRIDAVATAFCSSLVAIAAILYGRN